MASPDLPPSSSGDTLKPPFRRLDSDEHETPNVAPSEPATLAAPASPSDAGRLPVSIRVPGYEVLAELGRGGMGVVYKARQVKANRVVALKMILAGEHAGPADRARFQTEAEAVARLQHPGIVQVYEVGEHDGRPFFSLEFCAGGSLARKLSGTPLPPTEAASLVETLARAMHAAHQHRVIHRDLKPGNILLQSKADTRDPKSETRADGSSSDSAFGFRIADFEPKITDFGLAKKLDEAGQTASGAVMGTPSYMAPEQAAGTSGEVGPACDVYALGAILYECLTGRPPFRAATALDTLLQVRHEEPVPPRQLNAQVSPDLETVCLKCLRKDPGQRYGSALDLAEDLHRWRAGEPIVARAVGRLERAWRWCRRNPVVAGLLALVTALLIGGATGGTILAVLANDRAEEAIEARALAEKNEADAVKARDNYEVALAHSLLAPLQDTGAVTDPEIEALWALAGSPEDGLRVRFIEEAIADEVTTRQLRSRAPLALHAAVGLDPRKRARVERMLAARLSAAGVREEQRFDLALALVALGDLSPAVATQAARTIDESITRTTDAGNLNEMAKGLADLAARLEPRPASVVCGPTADALARAMTTPASPAAPFLVAPALRAIAAHLGPEDAARTAATLSRGLSGLSAPADTIRVRTLADALAALAMRMRPAERAAIIARTLAQAPRADALQVLLPALSPVLDHLDPKDAAAGAEAIGQIAARTTEPFLLTSLADGVLPFAARMEPRAAAVVCGPVADTLARALSATTDPSLLPAMTRIFSDLAARLEPETAGRLAAILGPALGKTTSRHSLGALAEGLSALAARMEPKAAVAVCSAAVDTLSQALDKKDASELQAAALGLLVLAPRLEQKEAERAAAALGQALNQTTDAHSLQELSRALAQVANRLAAPQRAAVCRQAMVALTTVLRKVKSSRDCLTLAQALVSPADGLDAKEARPTADAIVQAMGQASEPFVLMALSRGLAAATARLEPREAAAVCAPVADRLADDISRTTRFEALQGLAQGLAVVVTSLAPREAAATLVRVIDSTADPLVLQVLSPKLAAVAANLEPGDAVQPAATLERVIARTTHASVTQALSLALSALAARLGPKDAADTCRPAAASLTRAIGQTTDAHSLQALSRGLAALATRLEPREAATVCGPAADRLTRAMSATTNPNALQPLSQGLVALAIYLDSKQAGESAAVVVRAMTTAKGFEVVPTLLPALTAVAGRLDAKDAAEMAALLAQSINRTTLAHPLQGLSATLVRVDLPEQRRRATAVGAALGHLAAGDRLAAWLALQPALQPLPCGLSTRQLVDLLAQPLCVGQARRLVLDQLEARHGRPFADHWAFVRFTQEQGLDLDFTTAPRRPARTAAVTRK